MERHFSVTDYHNDSETTLSTPYTITYMVPQSKVNDWEDLVNLVQISNHIYKSLKS